MINKITIAIPTYNREDSLKSLLDSLLLEDLEILHEVIVIDNNSNYLISSILKNYPTLKIKLVKHSLNVGMNTNMQIGFLHCKSKWMWLLSDDDLPCKGALLSLSNLIQGNHNKAYIKGSTLNTAHGCEENVIINSLEDLIDYYLKDNPVRTGNLVFVSNGVFNLEILKPFIGRAFEFSYSYIGFLVPVFFALNSGIPVLFSRVPMAQYGTQNSSDGFPGWPVAKVALGLSTIAHLPLNLNPAYFKKFLRVTMAVKSSLLFRYLLNSEKQNKAKIFWKVYQNCYSEYFSFREKIKSRIFFLILSSNFLSTILGKLKPSLFRK